jgi:hypothetical protein
LPSLRSGSVGFVPTLRFPTLLLLIALTLAGHAEADKLKQYQEETPDDEAAQTTKPTSSGRKRLENYETSAETKPEPFPWMGVGLAVICFLVAAPFALKAYLNTAKELAPNEVKGPRRREVDDAGD